MPQPGTVSKSTAKPGSPRLHWFEHSGHFPHWDVPDEAARLILDRTGGAR